MEINNPEELASLKDKYCELDRALVSYKLTYKPGEHNRDAICRELDKIFPRWYDREIVTDGSSLSLKSSTLTDTQDVAATVRTHFQQQLVGHQDKDAVLALAEQLLADEKFVNNSEVEI